MKLLLFIHSLSSGGAERVTTNLANYWAEKGWNITIVTMSACDLDFYENHPSIHRIALCLDFDSTNLLTALKYNYRRIKALRNVLKQQQPDVALAMMTTANILLALAAKGLNIPVLGSERIHPPMMPLGRVWEWLRRRSYRHLAAVIALTGETAAWLQAKTTAQYVPIIPNAVSYPIASHAPRISPEMSSDNSLNLIAVGRLEPQKGFDRLLLAFAVLATRFPEWHLTILGEGTCRDSLERMRMDLGLEQRISLPGTVGNLDEWYDAADLYVMSSLFEGFPNTLGEAMAYGLPVVSVDCDTGPRDIIRHQVDGLLVPQNNRETLVEALATLMSDKALRRQYAARAVEIRERLSMETIVDMWEAVFTKIANSTP
jgi:glycosyltransferase involved in cell wall biosynthesis